ncbi:hypothetical protein [Methylobacterium sp. JK268]
MIATARFVQPLRPNSVEVLSGGYLAAAIWCADLRAVALRRAAGAEAAPEGASAVGSGSSVHRLVPRERSRPPRAVAAAILPFARAAV